MSKKTIIYYSEISKKKRVEEFLDVIDQRENESAGLLSEEQLENAGELAKLFGTSLPANSLLQIMLDHENHHKGQLLVYAGMAFLFCYVMNILPIALYAKISFLYNRNKLQQ